MRSHPSERQARRPQTPGGSPSSRSTPGWRGRESGRGGRPPRWQEALGSRLFLALSPRLRRRALPSPPAHLGPCETVAIPRRRGRGRLAGTWYPAPGEARGAVLLLPPWVRRGRGYFHRRGRLAALRRAGYHALTVDLPGFGGSGPAAGFFDRDAGDAIDELARRAGPLPLHLWGVSSGGYWAHPALARDERIAGAFFEDVAAHLLVWAWRLAPAGRPAYLFFRCALRRAYGFLDLGRHAPRVRAAAYVSGAADRGVPPRETRRLATAVGGRCLIVPGAEHLGSIKLAKRRLHALALDTFDRAETER